MRKEKEKREAERYKETKREKVCVSVCVRERERAIERKEERESVSVCVREIERNRKERERVFLCV
jgi:hypothetical protein